MTCEGRSLRDRRKESDRSREGRRSAAARCPFCCRHRASSGQRLFSCQAGAGGTHQAAEDVATAVVEAALAPPANGTIEVGGPEKFHLVELVARVLEFEKDPRKVVIDPDARYSGVKLSENSLIPGKDAKLGSTKFDWWLVNVAPPPKK
jgi:hypothetical protein